MSSTYLLRVEGVNLAHVIDDTDQLSVRRGGGLMLLKAITQLLDLLPKEVADQLKPIATGASVGLYEFTASGENDANAVRDAVDRALRTQKLKLGGVEKLHLRHGTFVVDVTSLSANSTASSVAQQAIAANRWRQLQQPTMSLHDAWERGLAQPCVLDRTRVATVQEDLNGGEKQQPLCESVRERWQFGRGARQAFYQDELRDFAQQSPAFASILATSGFTDDFRTLSARPANVDSPIPAHLRDKLAVFYVDGNKFGQKGRERFEKHGTDGYRDWSQALQKHHRGLLKGLIEFADQSPQLWKNGDEFRLETLLWGGDEILWVVPAWLGWEVARWFFSQVHTVNLGTTTKQLTYACGLVFCHANAPIKNVTGLAHRLGDLAKASRRPDEDSLAYEVLESFDDIAGSLTEHRRRSLPKTTAANGVDPLVIDPALLDACWASLTALARCPEFPMRQLYQLCGAWRRGNEFTKHEQRLKNACAAAKIEIGPLLTALGHPFAWHHLLNMLPYLPVRDGRAPPLPQVPALRSGEIRE